jgi:hypothetical protein
VTVSSKNCASPESAFAPELTAVLMPAATPVTADIATFAATSSGLRRDAIFAASERRGEGVRNATARPQGAERALQRREKV